MDSDIEQISITPEERLIPFLRNLADSIESKQLLPKQLAKIGEFFMEYQFHEQEEKDNNEDNKQSQNEYDREDIMKFFSLGWYVYTHLLNDHEN